MVHHIQMLPEICNAVWEINVLGLFSPSQEILWYLIKDIPQVEDAILKDNGILDFFTARLVENQWFGSGFVVQKYISDAGSIWHVPDNRTTFESIPIKHMSRCWMLCGQKRTRHDYDEQAPLNHA